MWYEPHFPTLLLICSFGTKTKAIAKSHGYTRQQSFTIPGFSFQSTRLLERLKLNCFVFCGGQPLERGPGSFSLSPVAFCWSLCSLLRACTVRGQSVLYMWILSIFVATATPEFFPLISRDSYSLKYYHYWASLIAQLVKNLPAMRETWVRSLGQEDPLEKEQATHSSILGFPRWFSWDRVHLQCGRPEFNPGVGKDPWEKQRLPAPVSWPGEFHGLYSPWGHKESDMTEQLSLTHYQNTLHHKNVTFFLSCDHPVLHRKGGCSQERLYKCESDPVSPFLHSSLLLDPSFCLALETFSTLKQLDFFFVLLQNL